MDCPALVNVGNEGSVIISAELEDAILALSKATEPFRDRTNWQGEQRHGCDIAGAHIGRVFFYADLRQL